MLVLFVRRQFKSWGLISNITLGPSGHGRKPPSSRLGTLYSAYSQRVMTKIHVLILVMFVRRQFNRWGSISNTTLGPSGHGRKPPSSWLGPCTAIIGNGLWQKSMYWAWFCLCNVNSSVWGWLQTPHWTPVSMVRSHHRRGLGPSTVPIVNGLWQKSMYGG